MDLTNIDPWWGRGRKNSTTAVIKRRICSHEKTAEEEVWAEVDAQAQAVFQNGESLKGFLDFMAQCNTQKTPNLLLIYGQNPQQPCKVL